MYIKIILLLLLLLLIIYFLKKNLIEKFNEEYIKEKDIKEEDKILIDTSNYINKDNSIYIDKDIKLKKTVDIKNKEDCLIVNKDNTIYGDLNCDTTINFDLSFNSNVFFDNVYANSEINFNNNLIINSNTYLNDICFIENEKELCLKDKRFDDMQLKDLNNKIEKLRGIRYIDENGDDQVITESVYMNNLNNFINN